MANIILEHIASFQTKLELFKVQFSMSVPFHTHFPFLKNQLHENKNITYQKYGIMTDNLAAVFFRFVIVIVTLACDFGIFSSPFQAVAHQSPNQFQLELIELQFSYNLKRAFDENDLVIFYKNYVGKQYPNLAKHALTNFVRAPIAANNFSQK